MIKLGLLLFILFNPLVFASTGDNIQGINPELRQLLREAINDSSSFTDKYAAEVWYTDMSARLSKYIKDPEDRLQMLKLIHQEASRAELAPELVLAVIHVESLFDQYAISRVGARGLMQVMPFWLKELKKPNANLFDVQTNLRMGCTILKYYLDKEKGNLFRGLGRYNGSLGKRKYPDKVIKAIHTIWFKQ